MKLKLCGIRRAADAEYLNEFPPDYAGFVFAESRRKVTLEEARKLSEILSPNIVRVGVFVNEPLEKMSEYADIIGAYQLHGDEDEAYINALRKIVPKEKEIWKAVRVKAAEDILRADKTSADKLLLDAFSREAYGGTGKTADRGLIENTEITKPFFIAGGITAENLYEAASSLKPFGIDLSGGIETNGVKDREKIKEITEICKKYKGNL